jgi:DNA invertase Pin-like site-specific DNA recombinase
MREGCRNRPPASDETRAKMSAAHRGKKQSPEHYAKTVASAQLRGAAMRGRAAWNVGKTKIDHAKVFELREQGLSYRKIATALNCSAQSVCLIMKAATQPLPFPLPLAA